MSQSPLPDKPQTPETNNKPNQTYQAEVNEGGAVAQGTSSVAASNAGAAIGGNVSQSNISTGSGGVIQHTGAGDIVQHQSSTNYVFDFSAIAKLFGTLHDFIRKYWLFLSVFLVVEIALLVPFVQYRSRFQLSIWVFMCSFVTLAAALWNWRRMFADSQRLPKVKSFIRSIIFTIFSIALIGQQVQAAIFPEEIDDEKFGIAIATFGDNSSFFVSERGKNIAESIKTSLDFALSTQSVISPDEIGLKRIGIVKTYDEALEEGKRVGAELIIWGEMSKQDDRTTVYFQIAETPILTDNPDFPRTLPLNPYIELSIPFRTSNSQDIAEILKSQNIGLAYFIFGLYQYHEKLNPKSAAMQFAAAQTRFSELEANNTDKVRLPNETSLNLGLVHYYLGKSLQLQGRYLESQENLLKAAAIIPRDLSVWLGIMYNFRSTREDKQALEMARCIIALSEQITKTNISIEDCPDFVIENWNQAGGEVQIVSSDETTNHYNQALAREMLKEFPQVLTLYQSILETHPDFFIVHLRMANILEEMGRFEEAAQQYAFAQELAAGKPEREVWIQLQRGKWYEKQSNLDGALLSYDRAVELNTEWATPHLFQARIYAKLDMDQEAIRSYEQYTEKSKELSRNPGEAYHEFAQFLYRIGHYDEAIDYYNTLISSLPFYDRALVNAQIGQAYTAMRNKEAAFDAFKQAMITQGPNAAYVHDLYGRTLVLFDDKEGAIEQFEQSIARSDDPAARTITSLNLAKLYEDESIGEIEKAAEIYRSIIDSASPHISQEYRHLAQEYLQALETGMKP